MIQMILTRLSSALERAFAPRQDKAGDNAATLEAPHRFSRDEAYYWAMHAHW